MIEKEREAITATMENKLTDNILKGARKGRELYQLKGRLFWILKREDERRKEARRAHWVANVRERVLFRGQFFE